MFYAYCGTETEDAVAIDNLRLSSKQSTDTSTSSSCRTAWMLVTDSVTSASSTVKPMTTEPSLWTSSSTTITTWPTTTTAPTNAPSTKQTTTPTISTTTPSLGRCECPTLCPSCYLPIHPNACVSKYNTCYDGFLYPQVCLVFTFKCENYSLFTHILILIFINVCAQECSNSNVFDPLLSSCTNPAMASCNKNETS